MTSPDNTPPAQTPRVQTPAGWYPDYTGEPRMRWWDGTAWSDHVTEPSAPAAMPPAPATPARNTVPATTPANNVFIWILVLLPVITLALSLTVNYAAIGRSALQDARLGESGSAMGFGVGGGATLAISLLGWLVDAAVIVLAYFDNRRLKATGFERPFPWPWAFFTLISSVGVLVYVIGRTVIVKRRSGRGLAPMIVAIALAALGLILGGVAFVQIVSPMFDQFGSGDFINS
ncbi:DUF2510 domain-containing protein [Lacisediminihabitans changchengi]|uniref:DUF2510 domain-containing protein n=1 Tax=Lacisediminihabitans changchengi TaxID=2787634 RepID=A0A934W1F6_9MICO|nr:DUF2510 domain-containing protein [Lacisediminihabitans changchengi]MBK4346818.1 DUF2510 domain-containing protein [Lacisediminihabitans changchengi]MBK4348059.1 DUF2510 domain-containing protein [Lacisediminihabitans changchengi]